VRAADGHGVYSMGRPGGGVNGTQPLWIQGVAPFSSDPSPQRPPYVLVVCNNGPYIIHRHIGAMCSLEDEVVGGAVEVIPTPK
jgi:hypothetical protein